ncbi:MAG: transglutaminase-like domain-containing protein [Cyanobacteriota bacterium]|nr:transglutaminase-like domain-containing protein [Cyanobacteriota bacterium]
MSSSIARNNFYREINRPDDQIDLAKAALYIAQEEYRDLDVAEYLNALETMSDEVKDILYEELYPLKIIKIVNEYLYNDLGFRGNTTDYYDPRNSFLNDVIERRTGIPIALSLIYLEIAKRIHFPMVGIGMPGHFLIRPTFEGVGFFVDAFNRGEVLFEQDCEQLLSKIYQQPVQLQSEFLEPISNRQLLARMLTNLKFIYLNRRQLKKSLGTVERILLLFPNAVNELRDRGLLLYELGDSENARQDLQLYLVKVPQAPDAEAIRQILAQMGF